MALGERVYSINHFKTESIVELTWLPGTQGMTDLCVFAEAALQHRAKCLIIDMPSLWVDPPPRLVRGAMT